MLLIVTPTLTQPQRNSDFTHCSRTWQTHRYTLRRPTRPGSYANSIHFRLLRANLCMLKKRSTCWHIYNVHHKIMWHPAKELLQVAFGMYHLLNPFPEKQLSSHGLATTARHIRPVKLWICWLAHVEVVCKWQERCCALKESGRGL